MYLAAARLCGGVMRKLLIGPALTGVGWLAGSHYGAKAEQIVHKSPDTTYAGIAQAFDNMSPSGTTHFEGGTPMPYEIKVDRTPGERLVVRVMFNGREGGETDIAFTPQNNGQDTLVTAKAHGDREVLRAALAGSTNARLAYAPDWMLNLLAVRPLLQQLARQVESGQAVSMPGYQSQTDWESSLPPDQQKQVQEWRQYEASRPMVDPNADAQRYMNGT
ncbi:hypothetical protein GCM10022276_09190 [Sphingomonas limnosediminicola]|uniref:Uncharacterized protein n=2 Tax=Sphingomonas limnosediminicola TaxID=940133 RepID=A0ABP7L3E6_9SPHN